MKVDTKIVSNSRSNITTLK